MTTYFSQGRAATDLRGGDSLNSNFVHRSLMNLTVKNMKIGPSLSKLQRVKVGRKLLTHPVVMLLILLLLLLFLLSTDDTD